MEEIFIDYVAPSHAGPGPHPTTESDSYHLTQGGIRWFAEGAVKYRIIGTEGVLGANVAIESAVGTLDGFITTRSFGRDDGSPSWNPCLDDGDGVPELPGEGNTIQGATYDGPGGVLAVAWVCRNVATKEIVGFRVLFDSAETWAVSGGGGSFDVENVAAHEMGHVAGLGHVNAPKDGCLTMYRYAGDGETQKRTLGWGDKLGLNVLYGHGEISSGPGCGS